MAVTAVMNATELSFDPETSRFILIGTSRCIQDEQNLQPLPAVHNNLDALERILTNRDIVGVPPSSVTVIRDPNDKAALSVRLLPAIRQARDLLFIYYVGHGLIGRQTKRLFLGTAQTTEQDADFDGYDFDELRLAMDASPAIKRILILDCCFSGNALEGTMGGTDGVIDASIAIRSTYAIASAPPNRLSIAEPGEKYTAFTGELVDLLENGTRGPEQFLSIDAIYEALRRRIALKPHLPEPRRAIKFDGSKLIIARNIAVTAVLEVELGSFYRLMDKATGEELRPMMKQWLEANLPEIVERLVRMEIERIVRRAVP